MKTIEVDGTQLVGHNARVAVQLQRERISYPMNGNFQLRSTTGKTSAFLDVDLSTSALLQAIRSIDEAYAGIEVSLLSHSHFPQLGRDLLFSHVLLLRAVPVHPGLL